MKSILVVWIFVALSILSNEINARTIKGTKSNSDGFKPVEGIVSCKCSGVEVDFRFPVGETLKDVLKAIKGEAFIKSCTKCSFDLLNCDSSYNYPNSCEKTPVGEFSKDSPTEMHIEINVDSSVALNRSRRDNEGLGACNFPRNLKTSYLSCTEHPNKIKCSQKCIFGHTLDEGISREMKCEFNENAWKPMGFQECNPFVDCSMTLVATGNKSCLVGTPYIPSVCNVTCGDYEDKVATPLTTFECQLNGGWDKPLPHCVISGSGFALVPPPRVKAHSSPDEHKKDEHKKVMKPQKVEKPKKVDKPQKHIKPQKPTSKAAPQPKH